MTPAYDLIIVSASRPHLLRPTVETLFAHLPVMPARILIHDDRVFPAREAAMAEVVGWLRRSLRPVAYRLDDPPIRHGPALKWLLDQVETEFVLYTQDDFETLRPLPIIEALADLVENPGLDSAPSINQIRFNKRATRAYKDTWQGRWYKKEYVLKSGRTVTVSDHWYFQTGVWRTAFIRAIVSLAAATDAELFVRSVEEAVNRTIDRGLKDPRDPDERAAAVDVGTFVYGSIGEDRFIQHLGGHPEDWAGDHARA